jgi:hypothetical protein
MARNHSARPGPTPAPWQVLINSTRGVHHVERGVENQDAWSYGATPAGATVVAVADGHGHPRHFRSARGSALAVAVARDAALAWAEDLDPRFPSCELLDALRFDLVPSIWDRWRAAVHADLAGEPFTAGERRYGDDEGVVAYGTTLLLALVVRRRILLAQIGDGDVVVVAPDGTTSGPLPAGPELDGLHTTSLCQADALDVFRVAVIDLDAAPVGLVLLATDGYGNAQVADPWQPAVGIDLAGMTAGRGIGWLADRLPLWVERCASSEGSGDDTTVALLVDPTALYRGAASPDPVTTEVS